MLYNNIDYLNIIKPCVGDFVTDTKLNVFGYLSRISDYNLAYIKTKNNNEEIQTFIRRLKVVTAFIQKRGNLYFRTNGRVIKVEKRFVIIKVNESIEVKIKTPTDCKTIENKLAFANFSVSV